MHVDGVERIHVDGVLGEDCTLGLACRAGGVDQQQWIIRTARLQRAVSAVIPQERCPRDRLAVLAGWQDAGNCIGIVRRMKHHTDLRILQDVTQFRRSEPPVQRRQDEPQPRRGKNRDDLDFAVLAVPGNRVARLEAKRVGHGGGSGRNEAVQLAIAQRPVVTRYGGSVRLLRSMFGNPCGNAAHSSRSPGLYSASRPIRSRQISAVHGSMSEPQRESR